MKMKARKNSLAGLTKEERIARRKASMTAGDSWADLHGTKDRPDKQFVRNWAKKAKKKTGGSGPGGEGGGTGGEGNGSPAAGVGRRASLMIRKLVERRGSAAAAAPAAAEATQRV